MLRSLLSHDAKACRRVVAAVLTAAALIGAGVLPADAQSGDPRSERARVRSERAEVATEVDALRADEAEVSAALAALDANVRGRDAAAADAQRAAEDARRQAEAARQAVAAKEAEVARLRAELADVAVAAYVNPPGDDFLDSFQADSASESLRKRAFLDARAGRGIDLLDELRAAQDELEVASRQADESQAAAAARAEAATAELAQARAARAQQAQFTAQVQARLDAKLGEAAALAATDQELSARITAQEAAIAAELARARTAPPSPVGGGAGGGGVSPPVRVPGPIALTNVGGITVASSIAGQLEGLLAAASAAGISFGGTGYRDSSAQIALRRQNCGTSDYAVYQMPAEQCSPATARPGASKHEQGLAVDFTEGGRTLTTSSAGYRWLVANAGRFGFVNLPGEPWHWSVGGG